jgi:MinD superfamily P-loop ATPase
MKQLVVLSGKGGTGKTTVVAALAHLMCQERSIVLADADVDAPNLGLILDPQVIEMQPFYGGQRAVISADDCTGCGRCEEVCRYDAIVPEDEVYRVVTLRCEGCATCYYQCPADAIRMEPSLSGHWYRSQTRFGPLVHALLRPGEENSGKLVSEVRQQALLTAEEQRAAWILVDGSPGIGCPVIAAVTGVDLALMVTEPTVSGVHDLQRALGVAQHFHVPSAVCINKYDLNLQLTQEIEAFCGEQAFPVLARLPYDEVVIEAMRQRRAVTEIDENPVGLQIAALWGGLKRVLER